MDAMEKTAATRSASTTNQDTFADADTASVLTDTDVQAMLETMKQSAKQLDGILQQLCEAEETDDEFPEEEEAQADATQRLEPVATLKDAQNVAAEAYFDAIVKSFEGEKSEATKVFRHDALCGLRGDAAASIEVDGPTFEGLVADVTLLFSEPASQFELVAPTSRASLVDSAELAWEPLDVHTLSQFQLKLYECLARVDPFIPKELSSAVGSKLLSQLSSDDCILPAIQEVYPPDRVDASTRVEWRRGNRICRIRAEERAWRRQWGLQIVLTVDCVARAQGLSAADPTLESQLGPALSCLMTSCVYVPKKSYTSLQFDSLAVTTSLTISLVGENAVKNRVHTGDSAYEVAEEETVLPELLTVYHYGGHATLGSESDTASSTPTSFDSTRGFQKLPINTPLPRNRIIQAACGRFHTLLLNDLGLMFSYGHAMDGCLGHGDAFGRAEAFVAEPKLVEFFFDKSIVVKSVACGGDDLTGFHSAAVTRDGAVYTWGVGIALGLGSVKSKSLPELVKLPLSTPTSHGDAAVSTPASSVDSIACGSGFCVAIASDGSAFAWGKWSDGRLGLGAVPIINRSSRLHGSHRQLQRFQLYPKRIGTDQVQWRKISCGDAHCIGLSRDGRVFTWGRGRQGQLGLGDGRSAMTPVLVPGLAKASWRDVAAGQDWSMAVDVQGAVWSWGACGGAVLGQFSGEDEDRSASVAEILLQKQQQLHQQQQQQQLGQSKDAGGLALPRFVWLRPRPIPSLSHGDVTIRSVDAGARHAAAVSMQGDLYVWGSPSQGLQSQPTLVKSTEMEGSISEQVFCGGSQIIALTSGSFLARDLQQLHSALLEANEAAATSQENQEPEQRNLRAATGADVVLLVGGGRVLFAHKLVLARRSSVLRELILNEDRDAASSTQRPLTEVLLPQLRVDITRILVEFLYTDNLTKSLDPLSYLIRDVLRAARQYKIPRLVRICRERIMSASYVPLGTLLADMEEDEEDEEELNKEGHALNQDLAFAFGDSTWADLSIVAENQSIPAHSCMLIARSEYFRALLAFGDQQQPLQSQAPAPKREIVVEESYLGMLRVLRFIYNDELTTVESRDAATRIDGADSEEDEENVTERLLEDLIAADKYGLVRMKRLCEHHIALSPANCVDVLVVADLVHAQHLKQLALKFIQTHLHVLTGNSDSSPLGSVVQRLAIEFPHLLTELHDFTQQHTQQQMLLRDWQKQLEAQWQQHQDAQAQQRRAKQAETHFPWVPLILALVFATLYLTMMNAHESDYPIVPAINVVVLGGLFSLAFLGKL